MAMLSQPKIPQLRKFSFIIIFSFENHVTIACGFPLKPTDDENGLPKVQAATTIDGNGASLPNH
jgi:hypothetical protein